MATLGFPDCAKVVKLRSGTTYSYVHIKPALDAKPTIVFFHGFPSSSWDWRHQIRHFSALGYGVFAPDLLGYGETDKPEDLRAYTLKNIASHVAEILQHERLDRVHAVGHDFGSAVLSRFVNYHPEKLLTCAFLSVPYIAPGQAWDIDALKPVTEELLGFEKYGYMRFMVRDDSWKIMEAHAESGDSLLYADDALWIKHIYPAGALEDWLKHDKKAPPSPFVTPDELATRHRIFATGGYRGPTNYYRVQLGGLGIDEEKRDGLDPTIRCPAMFVMEADGPGSMEYYATTTPRYAADCWTERVSTQGHWVQLEARDEVNSILAKFWDESNGKSASRL